MAAAVAKVERRCLGGSEPESFANSRQVGRQRNHKLASRWSASPTGDSPRGLRRPILSPSSSPLAFFVPSLPQVLIQREKIKEKRIHALPSFRLSTILYISILIYLLVFKNIIRVCALCASSHSSPLHPRPPYHPLVKDQVGRGREEREREE